jgi:hypothetical protein
VLSILYNMSADAYAKLVAHNNTVVQQFKTYKEAQERALAEAYSRLAALKEFCAKEREETREAFEKEKQALALEKQEMREVFEQEKQAMRDAFEREKQETLALEKERQAALALERQSALALERQSGGTVDTHQLANQALANFFSNF